MCGIAGIFNLSGSPPAPNELARMLAAMPYRGPDACGIALPSPQVGFGHLRLSILDLRPESNQPFYSADGQLALVFNGEIFNYVELRQELAALGHSFRTTSDTEVLLTAYEEWGDACVGRFNGMWAFAIYDARRRHLFCARDRFGIKPFNYAIHAGRILFASEIKSLLAVAPDLARPDYDSLSRILRASVGARRAATCFVGVKRLPPAHTLTVENGDVVLRRYWDYPESSAAPPSFDDASQRVRELLTRGIEIRFRSDVPVGLTLSGGVDSSSIAGLTRKFLAGSLDTFTAAYDGKWYDESARAREFALSLGLTPHLIPSESFDFLARLREIVWHLESPTHTPAVFPLWNIAASARQRVTVLLEGQGADELLAGYRTNFVDALLDELRSGHPGVAYREWQAARRLHGARFAAQLLGRRLNPPFLHKAFRLARGDESVYIGPLAGGAELADEREISGHPERLNAALVQQMEGRLVDLLHYGDAISMAHSLESRLPFLDHELVDYCVALPGSYKFRDGIGKRVLRAAMRGVVPDAILDDRRKLGFPTPIAEWFRHDAEKTIFPVLLDERCARRGIFDPRALRRALERHRAGQVDLSNNIYRWIITELWFQRFIDEQPCRDPRIESQPLIAAALARAESESSGEPARR